MGNEDAPSFRQEIGRGDTDISAKETKEQGSELRNRIRTEVASLY